MKRVVLDASALIATVCSPHHQSASRLVVRAIRLGVVQSFASAPILGEWRAAARYPRVAARSLLEDPGAIVEAVCRASPSVEPGDVPVALPDPDDEMYLAAALAAGAGYLVTFDARDLLPGETPAGRRGGEILGVRILEPGDFLHELARPGKGRGGTGTGSG